MLYSLIERVKNGVTAPVRYLKSLVTPPTVKEVEKLISELNCKKDNLELLCDTEIIKQLKERFPDKCPVLMLYTDDRVKEVKSDLYSEYSNKIDSRIMQLQGLILLIKSEEKYKSPQHTRV